MKSWRLRILFLIVSVGVFFGMAVPCYAYVGGRNAQIFFNDIKISINGERITPVNEAGYAVEAFSIDGTTYLPVRAIGNALGMDVSWNQNTKTVDLSDDGSLTAYYIANLLVTTGYRAQITSDSIYQNGYAAMVNGISADTALYQCEATDEQIEALEGLVGVAYDMIVDTNNRSATINSLYSFYYELRAAISNLRSPNDAVLSMVDAGLENYDNNQYKNGYDQFWNYYVDDRGNGEDRLISATYKCEEKADEIFQNINKPKQVQVVGNAKVPGTEIVNTPAPAPVQTQKPTATPNPTPSQAPQQNTNVQSMTVYITKTGDKYHRWGCQYLRQSCYSVSLSDAVNRGYTACSRCW